MSEIFTMCPFSRKTTIIRRPTTVQTSPTDVDPVGSILVLPLSGFDFDSNRRAFLSSLDSENAILDELNWHELRWDEYFVDTLYLQEVRKLDFSAPIQKKGNNTKERKMNVGFCSGID